MPGGAEAFEHGDALGRAVTIMQPKDPTLPANGWTLPDDVAAASGAGCASRIVYDPDNWPRHGDPASPASQDVLLKLLVQANDLRRRSRPSRRPCRSFSAIQGQLRLSCHPSKAGVTLSFPYVIENTGAGRSLRDGRDGLRRSETRAACASSGLPMLIGANGDATLGNFVPPEPSGPQMAVPIIALARRLAVGGVLEQRLEFPAPYAETSPWLPDLPPDASITASEGRRAGNQLLAGRTTDNVARKRLMRPASMPIAAATGGPVVSLRFPTTGLQFCRAFEASPTDAKPVKTRPTAL